MAHVGAVRQIVRAELAGEKLEKECRLVDRLSTGVEDSFVGSGTSAQFPGNEAEGFGPRDGAVVVFRRGEEHGLRDTSLGIEPEVAVSGEVG